MFQTVLLLLALVEKAAVIVTAAFLLSLVRPFQRVVVAHWSLRRALALTLIFSTISVSGSHLGVPVLGASLNTRAIGVLVAGLLGGPWVGLTVGTIGGAWFGLVLRSGDPLGFYQVAASIIDGLCAGLLSRRFHELRTSAGSAFLVSVFIQGFHLGVLGFLALSLQPSLLGDPVGRLVFAVPEVLGNATGVALFVLVLKTALEANDRETALSRQQAVTAEARYSALQAQIHPHFLYNTLNTIVHLVRTKPDEARRLLRKLADFYRSTLAADTGPIPLQKELETIQTYLDIEQVRFGERLAVEMDVAPDASLVEIPPLLLQPLVENAIRHGLSPRSSGGTVSVLAGIVAGELVVDVVDDGVGFDGARPGVGLSNVADRLGLRVGRPGKLEIEARPGGGTRVRVRLPVAP